MKDEIWFFAVAMAIALVLGGVLTIQLYTVEQLQITNNLLSHFQRIDKVKDTIKITASEKTATKIISAFETDPGMCSHWKSVCESDKCDVTCELEIPK